MAETKTVVVELRADVAKSFDVWTKDRGVTPEEAARLLIKKGLASQASEREWNTHED